MTAPSLIQAPRLLPALQSKNRRASTRYALNLPLRYRAKGSNSQCEWKHGQLIDMSANGIHIEIFEAIRMGTALELIIDWPGIYHGKPKVLLILDASFVRIGKGGPALRILRHQFRDIAGTPKTSPIRPNLRLSANNT